MALGLQKRGKVRNFCTVRYTIHFRLMWSKSYQNQSIILQKLLKKRRLLLFMGHDACCVPLGSYTSDRPMIYDPDKNTALPLTLGVAVYKIDGVQLFFQ